MTQVLATSLSGRGPANGGPSQGQVLSAQHEEAFRQAYLELIVLPDARQQLTHVARGLPMLQAGARMGSSGGTAAAEAPATEGAWSLQTAEHPPRRFAFTRSDEAVCIGKEG